MLVASKAQAPTMSERLEGPSNLSSLHYSLESHIRGPECTAISEGSFWKPQETDDGSGDSRSKDKVCAGVGGRADTSLSISHALWFDL